MRINNASGYIKKKGSNKGLLFDLTDKNKELLRRYNDVFNGLINKTKKIGDDWLECTKDYMKIKSNSHDILPIKKH